MTSLSPYTGHRVNKREQYRNHLQIFMDASVLESGKVLCDFIIQTKVMKWQITNHQPQQSG